MSSRNSLNVHQWTLRDKHILCLLSRAYKEAGSGDQSARLLKGSERLLNRIFAATRRNSKEVTYGGAWRRLYELHRQGDDSWTHVFAETDFRNLSATWASELNEIQRHAAQLGLRITRRKSEHPFHSGQICMAKKKTRHARRTEQPASEVGYVVLEGEEEDDTSSTTPESSSPIAFLQKRMPPQLSDAPSPSSSAKRSVLTRFSAANTKPTADMIDLVSSMSTIFQDSGERIADASTDATSGMEADMTAIDHDVVVINSTSTMYSLPNGRRLPVKDAMQDSPKETPKPNYAELLRDNSTDPTWDDYSYADRCSGQLAFRVWSPKSHSINTSNGCLAGIYTGELPLQPRSSYEYQWAAYGHLRPLPVPSPFLSITTSFLWALIMMLQDDNATLAVIEMDKLFEFGMPPSYVTPGSALVRKMPPFDAALSDVDRVDSDGNVASRNGMRRWLGMTEWLVWAHIPGSAIISTITRKELGRFLQENPWVNQKLCINQLSLCATTGKANEFLKGKQIRSSGQFGSAVGLFVAALNLDFVPAVKVAKKIKSSWIEKHRKSVKKGSRKRIKVRTAERLIFMGGFTDGFLKALTDGRSRERNGAAVVSMPPINLAEDANDGELSDDLGLSGELEAVVEADYEEGDEGEADPYVDELMELIDLTGSSDDELSDPSSPIKSHHSKHDKAEASAAEADGNIAESPTAETTDEPNNPQPDPYIIVDHVDDSVEDIKMTEEEEEEEEEMEESNNDDWMDTFARHRERINVILDHDERVTTPNASGGWKWPRQPPETAAFRWSAEKSTMVD